MQICANIHRNVIYGVLVNFINRKKAEKPICALSTIPRVMEMDNVMSIQHAFLQRLNKAESVVLYLLMCATYNRMGKMSC